MLQKYATQTKKKQLPKFLGKGLPALITSETYLLFKRLNINTEFLEKDPATWPQNYNYQEGQKVVNNLKVVNDMADHGVKLKKRTSNKNNTFSK